MNTSLARGRVAALSCVAVLMALGLTACGSSGGAKGGTPSHASGASAASGTEAQGLSSLLPPNIAQSKTLVVGIYEGGSSAMETGSGSNIVGFDPDLINAIGDKLGVNVEVKPGAFDSLIAGVLAGRYDVTIGGMADTKEREQSVSFVDYLNVAVGLTVKKGNPANIQGPKDLCGRKVAVITGGYPQAHLVPQLSAECTKGGKAALDALSFANTSSAVLAIQSGRADCFYADAAVAAYLIKTTNGEFEEAGTSQTLALAGIAFAKTEPQLGSAVQAALQALMKSGEYAAITKRWGLSGQMISDASVNKALI
jgi:polar amino acid transport system substrate-binding protein